MDKQEAFESLETIRTILERSTIFAHIAPVSLFLGGGTAVAASLAGWLLRWDPGGAPLPFLGLWATAFLIALGAGLGTSAKRARRMGEIFWSRKLQFVLSGFAPTAICAGLVTALMLDIDRVDLCPGIWMIFYGLGILAVGVVLDWEFRAAAWIFLLAGSVALFLWPDRPHASLGAAFGALHLALGAFRLYRESWSSCQDRQQPLRSFRI